MATSVTNMILLFAVIGEVTGSCVDSGEDNVVPVCTDCSKTGKVIVIDTSMVPAGANVICTCHIEARGTPTNFTITYNGPTYKPSLITFELMSFNFPCEVNGSVSAAALSDLDFRKGNYVGNVPDANLSISAEQTNATVTVMCLNKSEQSSTTSVPLSVTTDRTFSQTSQSTLHLLPDESSSAVSATNSKIVDSQTTVIILNTPVNGATLSQSQELGSNEGNQTVIIAGACGGAGGILLLIFLTLLLLYLKRSRIQKSNTDIPTKNAFCNSVYDDEVTENVVYNMEFADETKYSHDPQNEADVMCNSVDTDTQKESHVTNTVPMYQNLKVDNVKETFDTNNFDSEHQKHNKPIVTEFENQQSDEDGGVYNTVDFEDTTEAQTIQHNNTKHSSDFDSDPFYDTVEQNQNAEPSVETDSSVSTQNQETNVTYAVVNKTRASDKENERPKQFQVPESGDTYALVNKECV